MPCKDLVSIRDGSLYVEGLRCWLDDEEPRARGFVSHAHTDHAGAHDQVICTPETAALLRVLYGDGHSPRFESVTYGETLRGGAVEAQLLPSGHILGGAMMWGRGDGRSFIFAGDVRSSGSPTCPPACAAQAELLIIEDTFGEADAPFLDPTEGAEMVLDICAKHRSERRTTVLVCMSNCGKAQDVAVALGDAGIVPALQKRIWLFTEAYRGLGHVSVPYSRMAHGRMNDCEVCIVTRSYLERQEYDMSGMVANPAYVFLSGWAADGDDGFYDALVPWSDHASRSELLQIIEEVSPEEVWTFAGEGGLVDELRRRGYTAKHLEAE